jgi:hypothetical protein
MIDVRLCRGSLAFLMSVSFGREPSGAEDFMNIVHVFVSNELLPFSG